MKIFCTLYCIVINSLGVATIVYCRLLYCYFAVFTKSQISLYSETIRYSTEYTEYQVVAVYLLQIIIIKNKQCFAKIIEKMKSNET